MREQPSREPRDDEDAAAFQGMAHAITVNRERQGMSREELAEKSGLTLANLEMVERGELDESWGNTRWIAKSLGIPLSALMTEAEEAAPGPGGEAWRNSTKEIEEGSEIRGPRSDAAEGRRPCR